MSRHRRPTLPLLALAALLAFVAAGCSDGGSRAAPADADGAVAASSGAAPTDAGPPGEGFVVWESNRTGDWRIFIRDLDGSPPRQLTPDEGSRQHCCPHVSPDGRRIAYLSLPAGEADYPESGASGPLHLVGVDGTGDRVVIEEARTYFEHRAVVWRSDDELIYIDAEGRSRLHRLGDGSSRVLVDGTRPAHGWLVNRTLTHATTGQPTFSPYDAEHRRVREVRTPGGCQPYFSFDGRWGFWISGAGGPIRRIDLATREVGTVLGKNDPRIPGGQGYLYFPMLSHDSRLLAFAASGGAHSHERANYDVFIARTDPRTLEVVADAVRITDDRATDRYPDVYSRPLPLGRHAGEAPFTVELALPEGRGGDGWRWRLGDGATASGAEVSHSWERPGSYRVSASRGGETLEGSVEVERAAPPRVVDLDLRRGREVVVAFDEEIDADGAEIALESAADAPGGGTVGVAGWRVGEEGRTLVVELDADLESYAELLIDGVTDRAQRPNALPPERLPLEPPSWPSDRDGLVLIWQSDAHPNRVEDPESGGLASCLFDPEGWAWHDRHYAMELRGGAFLADLETMERLLAGCTATNELTIELTATPADPETGGPSGIFTFSAGPGKRNFILIQDGKNLFFEVSTIKVPPGESRPRIDLGPVTAGQPHHLLVTYTPGRLVAYVDGRQVADTDVVRSGFFHWKPRTLQVGAEWNVARRWPGTVEGIAVYNRFLDRDEALENHRRYARRLAEREPLPELRLRGTLERRSEIPTLEEIAPYRDALAVFEYRVGEVVAGDFDEPRVRVVHRVLVDGERTPVSQRGRGAAALLDLQPFLEQPQLQNLYLSNDLPGKLEAPLYFAPGIE